MKIGCVYSIDDYSGRLPFFSAVPFGISAVASALKAAGHQPRILLVTPATDVDALIGGYVKEDKPGLMCITAVSTQFPRARQIAAAVKQVSPAVPVILGGHHATLQPEDASAAGEIDVVCVGEGDVAAVAYAAAVARGETPRSIPNLWIKSPDGSIEKNPTAPFIEDLDSLPIIDRGMWDEWVEDKNLLAAVLLSRGCPYRCTYCSNHRLAKTAPGKYVRFRSPQNIVKEISGLAERYPGLGHVFLETETLSIKPDYAKELADAIAEFNSSREKPLRFGVNISVSNKAEQNRELFAALHRAGFAYVKFGLESGSERMRTEILRRPSYTNREFIDFCGLAREYGLDFDIYTMAGLPGETLADYFETIAVIRECNPRNVIHGIYYPYPGTDLYDRAREMGLIHQTLPDPATERQRAVLDLPGFPKKTIQREYILFPWRAFHGRKSTIRIAAMIARTYVGGSSRLNAIYRRTLDNRVINSIKKRFLNF